MDWSKTALGPVETWPQSLRTSVSLCLSSTFPILIAWGPETIQIYNDSYRPICGAKHPESMGQNFRICWETALPVVGDAFDRGQQGEGTYINDQRMFLDRYGYLEEAFMTFSFAPIRDESGGVGGIFHPITETTVKMLAGRRTQALRDLGAAIGKAKSVQEIGNIASEKYKEYVLDVPFMLFYQFDSETNSAILVSSAGLEPGSTLSPPKIDLMENSHPTWPLSNVLHTAEMQEVTGLAERFGAFSCEPYPEPPKSAMILPVKISGQSELFGFIVAGVSARRALDQEYLNFYDLLANTFNTAVSNVYAYEQEQKRAEALAAIDRSKTAFFSNVSHEFRTPLTLMLGPLEDLLSRSSLPEEIKEPIEATHRNALRLLKLVNNLLDYSRVEAGRVRASYQPLNLAELTADLASSFRSIIEKAGMNLQVDCNPTADTTFVDRQMWEKIVLNLLSNAFKYTLEGEINVGLKQENKFAVLEVQDSGVGIPEKELPHMFERFHRVENSAGRTHEGSGIGLSLVHELVHLHGGEISVDSVEGKGSVFRVKIPVGKAHLPSAQVVETEKASGSNALKGAFLQEAYSLLQEETHTQVPTEFITNTSNVGSQLDFSEDKQTLILVVDDNADMRAYLKRLLEPYFSLQTAVNGQDALTKIAEVKPDLVLSDVMMPVLDGKGMLQQIRRQASTSALPVIFLSARAGEEARIDGLEAGADDYLVKPFSAAELLTKIRAQIKISRVRMLAGQKLRSMLLKAPVAIAIYRGPDHIVEMANSLMLEYLGRTMEEALDRPILEVVPQFKPQGFAKIMDSVYNTGTPFVSGDLPIQIIRSDREETVYVNLTMEALRQDDDTIYGIIAVAANVTEQVNARKELEKVNGTLELAMEASGMGTWRKKEGNNALYISKRAKIIHGIPLDVELSFQDTANVIVPEHRDRTLKAIYKAIEKKGRFNEDYQIQPYDGSKRKWINSTGKVELDEKGEVKSVVGTILDITESKEDEIRKNTFIGMVSHELKTPLTSLNGYAQLLNLHASKTHDDFAKDKVQRILGQVKKMSTLVNSFLNVSRLEAGKIQLKKDYFSLEGLISEIIEEYKVLNSTHIIHFNGTNCPEISGDRDKIGNVLSNLISNAIKYSPGRKQVWVECEILEGFITVCVKDEGIGIKTDDLNKLFEPYYRVEGQNTEHIAGFGIGLYLSAEIIRRHNGKIWAESDQGAGSTFFFSLPVGNEGGKE